MTSNSLVLVRDFWVPYYEDSYRCNHGRSRQGFAYHPYPYSLYGEANGCRLGSRQRSMRASPYWTVSRSKPLSQEVCRFEEMILSGSSAHEFSRRSNPHVHNSGHNASWISFFGGCSYDRIPHRTNLMDGREHLKVSGQSPVPNGAQQSKLTVKCHPAVAGRRDLIYRRIKRRLRCCRLCRYSTVVAQVEKCHR
jgi:hypothetical protein